MSEYLRLTHSLLTSLGGSSSPQIFPLDVSDNSIVSSPALFELAAGDRKYEPAIFSFFQGALASAYVVGHIENENGPALPMLYSTVASGVLIRSDGELKPYFPATIRELVLVPDSIADTQELLDSYMESGLDIEKYSLGDGSYYGLRKNAASRILDILSGVKESVFLTFNESVEGEDFLIMVDGSLSPTDNVCNNGNWIGVINNPKLSSEEEKVSLKLKENEIGPPFKLGDNNIGCFWHLRMFSDIRKDPGWGLVKVENMCLENDDMESKIAAVSSGILAEKYPIHPRSDEEGRRLYPLITARMFLRTQSTDAKSILTYF